MPQQFGNFIYSFDQIVYIACRETCLLFLMWDFQTNFDDWYFNIPEQQENAEDCFYSRQVNIDS